MSICPVLFPGNARVLELPVQCAESQVLCGLVYPSGVEREKGMGTDVSAGLSGVVREPLLEA